jgi:hypothetical protein
MRRFRRLGLEPSLNSLADGRGDAAEHRESTAIVVGILEAADRANFHIVRKSPNAVKSGVLVQRRTFAAREEESDESGLPSWQLVTPWRPASRYAPELGMVGIAGSGISHALAPQAGREQSRTGATCLDATA